MHDDSNSIGSSQYDPSQGLILIDYYDNSDNPIGSLHLEPTPGPDPSLVHDYCEHTFSRDLMQLPLQALHSGMCARRHTPQLHRIVYIWLDNFRICIFLVNQNKCKLII